MLRVEPGELDLRRFERLVEDGRRAFEAGDAERAARALREARTCGAGGRWPIWSSSRSRVWTSSGSRSFTWSAIEERIEAELALGRHRRLVAELEALAAEHPLRERLRAQLMLALYRCGRQADALETYRRARAALVEQIGVEPGPELRTLHEAILRQDPALDAPAPPELPRSSRRSRRWSAATPSSSACATPGSGRAAIGAASPW